MTGKEKVQNAVNHKEGKIPLDFGATCVTGMHVSVIEQLRQYYGLEKRPVKVVEIIQMIGHIDDDLKEAMKVDTDDFWAPFVAYGYENENWKEWKTHWGQDVLVGEGFTVEYKNAGAYIYAQGDKNYPPAGLMPETSYFFDHLNRQKELNEDNLDFMDNVEEFGPIDEGTLEFFRREAKKYEGSTKYVGGMVGGAPLGDAALVAGPMLKDPKGIRDLPDWYMALVERPDYIYNVYEYQTALAIENHAKVYEAVGDVIDLMYICGADFGTQRAMLFSTETFKEVYLPHYKKLNDWVHKNTNWKTFKHCCGSIEPLLPLLIEAGFDIINPVQWTAEKMEMKMLKQKYGKELVFWGGGVDTQKTLPFGKPEEVRVQVLETCEIFGKDGGFVFNPIHNIVAKTPVENIVAMLDALHEFNA